MSLPFSCKLLKNVQQNFYTFKSRDLFLCIFVDEFIHIINMKRIILFTAFIMLLWSCGSSYQLYQLQAPQAKSGDKLVFENEDIRIGYNFYSDGGDSGFAIFNKSDRPLYVDLGNTHFVLNDIAQTYFQNRSYMSGKSVKDSKHKSSLYFTGETSTIEHTSAQTINEQRVIAIPSNTMKVFSGFAVSRKVYNEKKFATKSKNVKKFNNQTSPFKIRNVITYRFNETDTENNTTFENNLWVHTIKNVKGKEIYPDPRSFYIEYKKSKL